MLNACIFFSPSQCLSVFILCGQIRATRPSQLNRFSVVICHDSVIYTFVCEIIALPACELFPAWSDRPNMSVIYANIYSKTRAACVRLLLKKVQ